MFERIFCAEFFFHKASSLIRVCRNMPSFDRKIAARGYHVYKNTTWKNAKAGQKVQVQIETNKSSKECDPYACAIKIKNNFFDNWMTVGHIPRDISRHCFYFIKEGGSISGHLLSTNYKVSPIPAGGLEVPLLLTFTVKEDRIFFLMKDFIKNLYDYDYTGEKEDKTDDESDDDDEIEIVINNDKAEGSVEEEKNDENEKEDDAKDPGNAQNIIDEMICKIVHQDVIEID